MDRAVLLPLLLASGSVALYNLAQRFLPPDVHPFAVLLVIYLLAAGGSLAVLLAVPGGLGGLEPARLVHPAVGGLALAIVGIELGYLLAYRRGLLLAVGPLAANVAATLLLAGLGALLLREAPSARQALGLLLSAAGLLLVARG